MIKVLVVDDSHTNRELISEILEGSPYITVVGTAADGEEAIQKVVRLKPDLITLDLEMPRMDGFTFLRWLMRSFPVPVLVISSRDDDKSVIRALEFGAVDFLPKPINPEAMEDLGRELIEKVKLYATLEVSKLKSSVAILDQALREKPEIPTRFKALPAGLPYDIVAIGSSTGGPPALQTILTKLPKDFSAPVVICQHMPQSFTKFFAERLDKLVPMEVKEAENGDLLKPGRVLIAPGGRHMSIVKAGDSARVAIHDALKADKYIPSVDIMMESVASLYGMRAMGIILTGMGNDGRSGMGSIKKAGGLTLAESQETAVIYGMPREAIEAGHVDLIVPLGRIASEIIKSMQSA